MLKLTYDGSFEGFLSVVFKIYNEKLKVKDIENQEDAQKNLPLFQEEFVVTHRENFNRVFKGIKNNISPLTLKNVLYCFYSYEKKVENLLLTYLQRGFKIGSKCNYDLTFDAGVKVNALAKKVSSEVHRMMGFIRFQEIKPQLYYAPFESDHNILGFLVPHFKRRFFSQNWILHDVKRRKAAFFFDKKLSFLALEEVKTSFIDEFENLWKQYTHDIAIKEKNNLKLQKKCLPLRYWKYLTEMQ